MKIMVFPAIFRLGARCSCFLRIIFSHAANFLINFGPYLVGFVEAPFRKFLSNFSREKSSRHFFATKNTLPFKNARVYVSRRTFPSSQNQCPAVGRLFSSLFGQSFHHFSLFGRFMLIQIFLLCLMKVFFAFTQFSQHRVLLSTAIRPVLFLFTPLFFF